MSEPQFFDRYFEELARATKLPDPKGLARQIVMLHEGAIAYAQVLGCEGVADTARRAAENLIAAARLTSAGPSKSVGA